jgi:hypothetical protein
MTNSTRCISSREESLADNDWDRRKFVFALSGVPLVLCLPSLSIAASTPRSLPSASDQAKLQHLLNPDEVTILSHAALAPSGHNAQPWTVQVLERGHWIVGTDKRRWLPAVDPNNRETTLSIGAFLENLIIAAGLLGYAIEYRVIANATTDPRLVDLRMS